MTQVRNSCVLELKKCKKESIQNEVTKNMDNQKRMSCEKSFSHKQFFFLKIGGKGYNAYKILWYHSCETI